MLKTVDRIKMLKYRLFNPTVDTKEKMKILDLFERGFNKGETIKELQAWFKELKELSEDMIKDEEY